MPGKRMRMTKTARPRSERRVKRQPRRKADISLGTGKVYDFPKRWANLAQSSISSGGATADGTYCEYTTDANGANYILVTNHATESNYGTLNFAPYFQDFAGFSELQSLFQEYRIVKVDIELVFYATTSQATGAASSDTQLVIVHSCPYTSTAPSFAAGTSDSTCVGPLRQYDGYTARPALVTTGQPLRYTITKPTVTVGGNSVQEQSPWLPVTQQAVPHFGRVFVFEYINSSAGSSDYCFFKATARAHIQVRHNR
jgi:uncharacterized protein YerC